MIPALASVFAQSVAGDLVAAIAAELNGLTLTLAVDLDVNALTKGRKGARGAVIRAINRAAKPVRGQVEASAGGIQRFGFLAKSIGTKTRLYPNGGFASVVGPKMSYSRVKGKYVRGKRAGENKRHVPYLYAWLLERGTTHSARRPFLEPAWKAYGSTFQTRARAEIEAELAKLFD